MGISIKKLRGIDEVLAEKLSSKGLATSDKFLDVAKAVAGRKELAKACDVDVKVILELANRADLARVKGVAGVFGDLLEAAGVDTVKELATRRPDNLHAKILQVNADKSVAGRNPTEKDVISWVSQAKELPPTLVYK